MLDTCYMLERYPNLAALLEGRCGPISQWPGVPSEILALLEENERLRAALIPAEEWMAEDGCDCGTDEPGTCALCLVRGVLRGEK